MFLNQEKYNKFTNTPLTYKYLYNKDSLLMQNYRLEIILEIIHKKLFTIMFSNNIFQFQSFLFKLLYFQIFNKYSHYLKNFKNTSI
jgi:hypothetical protein